MSEVVKAIIAIFSALPKSTRRQFGQMVAQAAVTIVMVLGIYAGYWIVRERSITDGLSMAFLDSAAGLLHRDHTIRNALLQEELRAAVAADKLVDRLLSELINKYPDIARIRVAVFHNGIAGLSGMALMRADISNAAAAPGRSTGELSTNIPLSAWAPFMEHLLVGECVTNDIVNQRPVTINRQRLIDLGVVMSYGCPITDVKRQMLGTIFVQYDRGDKLPTNTELAKILQDMRQIALQIAAAWDVRGGVSDGAAYKPTPKQPPAKLATP